MAKRKKNTPTSGVASPFDKINDLLNEVSPDGGMMDVNPLAKIDEWIGTGNYALNAVLSGSLYGGLPNRRSLVLAGEEGTAKTFIAMSIVRQAIQMGYHPVYFDSEGSIDREFTRKLGVDPGKVRLEIVNTIEQFSHISAKITELYDQAAAKGEEMPKMMVVLDSLGNLTSSKEKADTTKGDEKRDMTKQQAIRKLFRVNGIQFAKYGIPFVVIAHTYASMSMFSPTEIAGGGGVKYNASIILALGKGKLKDDESEKKAKSKNVEASKLGTVIYVNPYKQRFARPIKIQMHIPYYKPPNPYVGLEAFTDWEHCGIMRGKSLIEREYNKLTPGEQSKCKMFTIPTKEGGKDTGVRYAFPKETARTIVVRHLNGEIPHVELWSDKVFTEEVLREMDEHIIQPTFKLPDLFALEDEQKDLAAMLEASEAEAKAEKAKAEKDGKD